MDNTSTTHVAFADVIPKLIGGKPVAVPGGSAEIVLGSLRQGQRISAAFGASTRTVPNIPPAAPDGTTRFTVAVSADHPPGVVPIVVSGEGVTPTTIGMTIVAAPAAAYTTEEIVFFDGFDGEPWAATGTWATMTLSAVVARFGTDRRQAFTRADGNIAVADAASRPASGTLTSGSFGIDPGEHLELRADHHFRARGTRQTGRVVVRFDDGNAVTLGQFSETSIESALLSASFRVPPSASAASIEFTFDAPAGSGSWMLDDVQVVRPLGELTSAPTAVIDVFSDVQGAASELATRVLPGLAGLNPPASTLVINGDLVRNGASAEYDAFFAALAAGGGDRYGLVVSTIGNHEYYGDDGPDAYRNRFLDRASMRDVGGQGGLWGEVLVNDALPVLWIGSEAHDFTVAQGDGPFVELSDEQFGWLQDRLAYWREHNAPVVLFSHHLLPYTVSATYATFYGNDFGADTRRLQALLAAHPNVTMLTGHTHAHAGLADWGAQVRFNPTCAAAPTVINTGSVTTTYGPSGDWDEAPIDGCHPIGVRVALYDDRLRVTAYEFTETTSTELRRLDIALPVPAPIE